MYHVFLLSLLVPFLSRSRRPLSFSSTLVCVRSVFQMAISNGWCLSLKARSVELPLVTAVWWFVDAGFSSRVSRWVSFSRCGSFDGRADRCSTWELEIFEEKKRFRSMKNRLSYLALVLLRNQWSDRNRKEKKMLMKTKTSKDFLFE